MKVNLVKPLIDLNGNVVRNDNNEEIILSKFLANRILMENADSDVLVKWDLANRLNAASGEIEIGENDKEIIKTICNNGVMSILIAAQILIIINNTKD